MSEPRASVPVELRGLSKSFGDVRVLESLDLAIEPGEIFALLGLSGSGKTTALRLLAGFETPDAGRIVVGGDDVTGLSPRARGFGMVFQHYALFSHMTVRENVAFGLESQSWKAAAIDDRIAEMLRLVDLDGLGARRVSEISGGQQQRVALARALAPEPRLLLLDEPLSNLDPSLRERTRRELREAVRRVGITTVLVTHEQEEAFHVGDRVAVLHRGRLEQVGTPRALYRRPTSRFVASFVGRASALPGRIVGTPTAPDTAIAVDVGATGRPVVWTASPTGDGTDGGNDEGRPVELVVRPESLMLVDAGAPDTLAGTVHELRFTGLATYAVVALDTETDRSTTRLEVLLDGAGGAAEPEVGERVHVGLRPSVVDASAGSAPTPRAFPVEAA